MESKQCEICGKVIEGFSIKQVNYLMKQHGITHDPDFEKPNYKSALIEIFRLVRNTGRSNMVNKEEIKDILDKYKIKFEELNKV